jgi:hypothetical protein
MTKKGTPQYNGHLEPIFYDFDVKFQASFLKFDILNLE